MCGFRATMQGCHVPCTLRCTFSLRRFMSKKGRFGDYLSFYPIIFYILRLLPCSVSCPFCCSAATTDGCFSSGTFGPPSPPSSISCGPPFPFRWLDLRDFWDTWTKLKYSYSPGTHKISQLGRSKVCLPLFCTVSQRTNLR